MKGSRKKAKAGRIAFLRHRANLMLDHIEWMLPVVRAALKGIDDDELLKVSDHVGALIDDPFGTWIWRQRKLSDRSPAHQQLEALRAFNLHRIIAGELPVPEGRWLSCPHAGLRCKHADGLMTFDELREHLVACTTAHHIAGIAVSDPWDRIKYRDPVKRPTWRWTFADRAREIVALGGWPNLCRSAVRRGEQMALIEASA